MKLTLVLFVLLCLVKESRCADTTSNHIKRNIFFATFGGRENFGSINFERVFSVGKKLSWSYSVGVQPFNLSDKFSLPLSINAFTSAGAHHFEVDLTATFYMDKFHPYNGGYLDDFNKRVYVSPFLCYRYQNNKPFLFKVGLGPQLLLDPPSNRLSEFKTELLKPSIFASAGISF